MNNNNSINNNNNNHNNIHIHKNLNNTVNYSFNNSPVKKVVKINFSKIYSKHFINNNKRIQHIRIRKNNRLLQCSARNRKRNIKTFWFSKRRIYKCK